MNFDSEVALVEEELGDLHIQRVAAMLLSPSPRDCQLVHEIHRETQSAFDRIHSRSLSVDRKAKKHAKTLDPESSKAPPSTARISPKNSFKQKTFKLPQKPVLLRDPVNPARRPLKA
ncbi:unnamed protein product, partial [Mesorhabditis belari]|uniref:Uncharacterized protein n=1 Tax=Mesorhabditis belari TaxID=2138241 RepID=A0AAF3EQP3_9BILA